MKPPVTFVIPVYNGLSFLHEAITSVVNQTSTHWNLLLIDDASTDGSRESLAGHLDDRISVHYNPRNLGLYATLSIALQAVETEWVSILMQDDRLKPSYLAEMLTLAGRYANIPVIWANEDIIGRQGQLLRRGKDTSRIERIDPVPESWRSVLMQGCIWTISGSFTKADFMRALPFRTDLPHCGDYEWLLRAIRISPLLYYQRTLAELREHSGQASAANLASGRNVRESYAIIAENFRRYPADITFGQALAVCSRRARLALRQMLGAIAHGRVIATGSLAKYAVRFASLPISYQGTLSQPR
ncbi:MAG: glycosyltransferase [Bryobacteraceae bacterium]|jgi:glycosyltransferase involved in cell wall biosynthesis